MSRKPIISGNWKMHNNHFEAIQLVQKLGYVITEEDVDAVDVTVHPPFTDLRSVQTVIDADRIPLVVGAQHCHHEESGAFTG
ncbi:MAG: triose-phosphate isomerase, partial [Acidimicrobiales bacterium]